MPIVIGSLGTMPKCLLQELEKFQIKGQVEKNPKELKK